MAWRMPLSFRALHQSAVPAGVPSSGTIAANGALTLATALPTVYPWIYFHFPAGAVYAGSPAGLYLVSMSSTAVGQVFNNLYQGGEVALPTVPVPVVGAGPGSYTQVLTEVTLRSCLLPGRMLGLSGKLRFSMMWTFAANANWKGNVVRLGATAVARIANPQATSNQLRMIAEVANRGAPNRQISSDWAAIGQGTNMFFSTSVDTSVDQTIAATGQLYNASDFQILEQFGVEVLR